MTQDHEALQTLMSSSSIGYTAYRAWGKQARRERRYNIARLFEALAAAKEVRAERALQELGEVGDTAANLARARAGLQPPTAACGPATGTTMLSRQLLTRGLDALAEDRDLRTDELGDLYVCGNCGELREGEADQTCAVCGTVPEGQLAFRAVEGMGILGSQTIMAMLERSEDTLRKLLSGLEPEQLAYRGSGPYSISELIGHLIDMDGVFRERAWLILETDEPELPPAHPPTLESAELYRYMPASELLAQFHASRAQTLSLLRGLTAAAWRRIGHHETFGVIPLTHQGNWVISHERDHLAELAQMRHDLLVHSGNGSEPATRVSSEFNRRT